MTKLNKLEKQNLVAGALTATAVLAIGSCVAAGISLITNLVLGSLNIANASKTKNIDQLKYTINEQKTYTNIF